MAPTPSPRRAPAPTPSPTDAHRSAPECDLARRLHRRTDPPPRRRPADPPLRVARHHGAGQHLRWVGFSRWRDRGRGRLRLRTRRPDPQHHRWSRPLLEAGCCVHYAPPNAASFLISHAVKLVRDLFGVDRFFAYADPEAGEYGAVYQAANWHYLGQGLNGKRGYRRRRQYVLPPGHNPRKANWRSDRDLRRQGRRLTVTQARAQGWKIETRAAKHVYAVCLGRNRAAWRESLPSRPYPKPRPALKGQGPSPAIGGARDQSLPVAVVGFLGRTCTCAPRKKSQLRYRESPEAKGPDAHHRSVSRK